MCRDQGIVIECLKESTKTFYGTVPSRNMLTNVAFVKVVFLTVVHKSNGTFSSLFVGIVSKGKSQDPQVVVFMRIILWVRLDLGANFTKYRFVLLNEVACARAIIKLVGKGKRVGFGTILVDPWPCLDCRWCS